MNIYIAVKRNMVEHLMLQADYFINEFVGFGITSQFLIGSFFLKTFFADCVQKKQDICTQSAHYSDTLLHRTLIIADRGSTIFQRWEVRYDRK